MAIVAASMGVLLLAPAKAEASAEQEMGWWVSVEASTGLVENTLGGCYWSVCGDPESQFRSIYASRGLVLIDASTMDLAQLPSIGWWYVDGTFVRDTFQRNVAATARILGVKLTWSTNGLGDNRGDVTFAIDVQPTGQRFTTTDSRLLIDPLEADVEHTFTITATRADGTTVTGPIIRATPKVDPDPLCQDRSVARECRAATAWAVIDPATMIVANAVVCTPWVCGEDGEWGGRMPTDTPWPNFLLVELTGSAGIGWKYVDGEFIDVRPRPEDELDALEGDPGDAPDASGDVSDDDATDGTEADTTTPDGATGGTDASTDADITAPEDDTPDIGTGATTDSDTTVPDDDTDLAGTDTVAGDLPLEDRETGTPADDELFLTPARAEDSSDESSTSPMSGTLRAVLASTASPTPDTEDDSAVVAAGDEEDPQGAVRRVVEAVVGFFRSVFGG